MIQRKIFFIGLFTLFYVSLFFSQSQVLAQGNTADDCENVVPNVLNPGCDPSKEPTIGGVLNNFIPLWPVFLVAMGLYGVVQAIIKFTTGEDQAKEGWQILIRTFIAQGIGLSIWIIMYILEQVTGVNLLIF